MIEFDQACELASRYFGLHCATSCIGRAWSLPSYWIFEPANIDRFGKERRTSWNLPLGLAFKPEKMRLTVDKNIGLVEEHPGLLPVGAVACTDSISEKYLRTFEGGEK